MAVKPKALEYRSEQNQTTHEATVAATKTATPLRFVKYSSGLLTCDAQGERAIGVCLESMYPGAANDRATDFDAYTAGDKAPYVAYTDGYVLVEAGNQADTAPAPSALITTTATGKAEVAATGDYVLGVDPTLETYGGVKYYRFRPAWDNGEVVA